MKYQEIKTEGFLTNFIVCFWEYQSGQEEVEHTILPDGCFDLIVVFEDQQLKTVLLTGVWTIPVNVTISKNSILFGIRFKLLAAEYLFKQRIKSILDTIHPLPHNFWEINALNCSDFGKAAGLLSNRISLSIKHLKEIDSRKLKLFELAYQGNIQKVSQLSAEVFWNSRQINRYFDQQFGFSLKTFLSIVRCNASYEGIAKGELFPAGDYFDQAHFIKEIRKYTNTTPRELSQNKNDRFLQLVTKQRK